MSNFTGYNRHLINCKGRKKKKYHRFGKFNTLAERLTAESKALEAYQKRVGQLK
jgi:hypothetical protein